MASLRDFLGSPCPHCRRDILQVQPSANRMPDPDLAWCPACKGSFTSEDLARGSRGPGGFFRRLFGRSTPQ